MKLIDKLPWEDIELADNEKPQGSYIVLDKQQHQSKRVKYNRDE